MKFRRNISTPSERIMRKVSAASGRGYNFGFPIPECLEASSRPPLR
jgi:hypothetical protein